MALKSGRFQRLVGAAYREVGYRPENQESQDKSRSVPKLFDAVIESLMRVKEECVRCHHRNCASTKLVAAQGDLNQVFLLKSTVKEGPSAEVLPNKTYCVVTTDGFKH